MKRAFDLITSVTGLIVLAPLLLVIASVTVLFDGFPILFKQERTGRHGRRFNILKFRTMTNKTSDDGRQFNAGDNSRVTRFGHLLRKSKLDELPQLLNVLSGDMSVVGPRPEVPYWTDAFAERWEKVLHVRPGITDPASIEFRHEEDILAQSLDPDRTYAEKILPRKLDLYEQYTREHSMTGDLWIILRTIKEIVK